MSGPQGAAAEEDILVWQEGTLGRIRLNRPKALNALNIGMIRTIVATLAKFEADPEVAIVVVDGAGERGLCAGGDIRALYDSGKAGDGEADIFWREEYDMNAQIATFPKPYVAFMDGITMGGGVGISAHGAHRVVTERTKLAMPETGIGFFPDVGGTWLLARAPGEVGTYVGLTGAPIGGADAIYAGMADVLVAAAEWPEICAALAALSPDAGHAGVNSVLRDFAKPVEPKLAALRDKIDMTMAFDTIPEILAALDAEGSDFAQATAKTLSEKSPTSLVLTLRLLRLGRGSKNLRECLDRELFGAERIMRGHDFYEGVRAAIIDKDRQPKWQPTRISEVSDAMVQSYFQ